MLDGRSHGRTTTTDASTTKVVRRNRPKRRTEARRSMDRPASVFANWRIVELRLDPRKTPTIESQLRGRVSSIPGDGSRL